MGRFAHWRICGAIVGQTTLMRAPERCPVESQSGVEALSAIPSDTLCMVAIFSLLKSRSAFLF